LLLFVVESRFLGEEKRRRRFFFGTKHKTRDFNLSLRKIQWMLDEPVVDIRDFLHQCETLADDLFCPQRGESSEQLHRANTNNKPTRKGKQHKRAQKPGKHVSE